VGVGAIVAPLFARIFFRNALNLGIPCFTADLAGQLRDGQEVELELARSRILTDDGRVIQLPEPPAFLREVWAAGGIVPFYRAHGRFPGEAV
jgi:methanogen homoaconitase small subunit